MRDVGSGRFYVPTPTGTLPDLSFPFMIINFPDSPANLYRRFKRAETTEEQIQVLRDYLGLGGIDRLLEKIDTELEKRDVEMD